MQFSDMIPRVAILAVTTFAVTTVAWASGLRPPIRNSGAVTTPDGVQVAVLGQSCSQTVETDLPGNDLVEMTVQIEVRNGTSQALGIHRDGFRLTGRRRQVDPDFHLVRQQANVDRSPPGRDLRAPFHEPRRTQLLEGV